MREYLMFWTRETFANVRRNPLMSLLAISTVTVGLFLLGAFYLTLANLRGVVAEQTRKLDITVFLESDISDKRRKELVQAAKIPQVRTVQLVTREQALAEFKKKMPKLPLADFDTPEDNPLNDELRLTLNDPAQNFFAVRKYFDSLRGKGVLETRLEGDDAVRTLIRFNTFLFWAGLAASIAMALGILLIIHNAIRLTIYARRREIRIMELVGATPGFIRIPFLLEGLLYGAAGAILAALFLGPTYAAAASALQSSTANIIKLGGASLVTTCVAWMLAAGLLFGLLGSWFSVSRNAADAR